MNFPSEFCKVFFDFAAAHRPFQSQCVSCSVGGELSIEHRFPSGNGRRGNEICSDHAASHRPFQSQVCSWMWVESFIDFRVVRRRKIVLYARKCTKSSSIPRRGPLPTSVAIGFACGDSTIGAELRLNSAVVLLVRAKSQQRDAYTMFRCLI